MRPTAKNPLYKPWFANIMATFRSPSKCSGNLKARFATFEFIKNISRIMINKCSNATIPTKIAAIISTLLCPLYSLTSILDYFHCAILSTKRPHEAYPLSVALPTDRNITST